MTRKEYNFKQLVGRMRSAGQHNWGHNDMQEICEMAGMYDEWLESTSRFENEKLALRAAVILGVEIRHYVA